MIDLFRFPGLRHERRPRLTECAWTTPVYAIGDIHGCLSLLRDLEGQLAADLAQSGYSTALLVTLGDHIDRGPDSGGVIDHLLSDPPRGFHRVILTGNHEVMMLDFLNHPSRDHVWLDNGGAETLVSYGIDPAHLMLHGRRRARQYLASYIPDQHVALLRGAAICFSMPGITFVHAGLRPGRSLARQRDDDMVWLRPDQGIYARYREQFGLVVHGHTPVDEPSIQPGGICLDTGAFATGVLSAARFDAGKLISVFQVARPDQAKHFSS